jgi:Spy/CpxP family protein refolding chaperone
MRNCLAVAVIVFGLASSAAMTQEPQSQQSGRSSPPAATASKSRLPFRWWNDEAVVKKLGLTAAQVQRIEGIFEAFLPAQRARWSAFRPLEKELNDLVSEPHPNEARVIDQITRVETLRSELNQHRLIMLFRIQQVLTAAQRARLQELGWPETGSRRQ